MKSALRRRIVRLIAVGDSNIVIKQVTGEHRCKEPHLAVLLDEVKKLAEGFEWIRYVHVTREFNAAADYVGGKTVRLQREYEVDNEEERIKLQVLNKLQQKVVPRRTVPDEAVSFLSRKW